MSARVEKIIAEAMQLSSQDRATIAERLISSLEPLMDSNIELAWQREVQQRVMDIESGNVVCIPWEEVRERLRDNARTKD
jgi:putative addiction module component (TIGR02574 family)